VNTNPKSLHAAPVSRLPWVLVVSSAFWWGARTAPAQERDVTYLPGYVNGDVFRDLADEAPDDTTLIDVTLDGPLLRVLAKSFASQNDQMGSILTGLEAINAVIIGFDEEAEPLMWRARQEIRDIVEDLPKHGWSRLARVREKDQEIYVLARHKGEDICGLAVLVSEQNGEQIIFVNIVGKIDLAKMGLLGEGLNLPGLIHVPAKEKRPAEQDAAEEESGETHGGSKE